MSTLRKPIIAVTGATGTQGGSVVRFLLADGGFTVRAITRDLESAKSISLKEKGVELFKADFDDVESLTQAFEGAHGVFGVSNYWNPSSPSSAKEIKHGKAIVDAAKAAGVQHFVISALEPFKDLAHGVVSDSPVTDYVIQSGLPRTTVYTGFYFENFIEMDPMKLASKSKDGNKTIVADWPILKSDALFPGYSVGDTGAFVVSTFKNPTKWIGKDIKLIGEIFSPREFVAAVEEVSGKKILFTEVDDAAFDAMGENITVPALKQLHANFAIFYESNASIGRTPEEVKIAKELYPQLLGLKAFVKANLDKILPAE